MTSDLSSKLQDIERGNHADIECEEYCDDYNYRHRLGQKLPDCQFKGDKSKFQSLVRKIHIDADGRVTKVQFGSNIMS